MTQKEVRLTIISKGIDEDDEVVDIQTFTDLLVSGEWKKFICVERPDGEGFPELDTIDVIMGENSEKLLTKSGSGDTNDVELDHTLGISGLDQLDGFNIPKRKAAGEEKNANPKADDGAAASQD